MKHYIRLLLFSILCLLGFISPAKAEGPVQFPLMSYQLTTADDCDFLQVCSADDTPGIDGLHLAEDLHGAAGTPVYAPADGVVKDASVHSQLGLNILVESEINGETVVFLMGHLRLVDKQVSTGDTVVKGQLLGYLGQNMGEGQEARESDYDNGGWDPHLHFGVHKGAYEEPNGGYACDNQWNYQGYAEDACVFDDWYDPADFILESRDSISLSDTNLYGNATNWLGSTVGEIHWWNSESAQDLPNNTDVSNGYANTLYIQDFDGAYCDEDVVYGSGVNDGAIVYDALGGGCSAYIVQCEQWQEWINTEDTSYIGPESSLGNPVTNVFKRGSSYYQLFQGGYLRTNVHGNTYVKSYAYGFAPGEMADGSWNPQISYRFAEAYENRGAAVRASWQLPRSGVVSLGDGVYAQRFRNKALKLDTSTQTFMVISASSYDSLIAGTTSISAVSAASNSAESSDNDRDGFTPDEGDCDDTSDHVNPDHAEWNDGLDNDCDDDIDEADSDSDLDRDSFTPDDGDCDDTADHTYPDAPELWDGVDNDCDDIIDDAFDRDGDGYSYDQGDCDEDRNAVHAGAPELTDGLDNDCDGYTDEDRAIDLDGDGYSSDQGDCNELTNSQNPGMSELTDGLDNDCDGLTDEDANIDLDGDGYSYDQGDCDETRNAVHAGAQELTDGIDNDCDGSIDEDANIDLDGDGYSSNQGDCDETRNAIHTGASELIDGLDNDCDGDIDEAPPYEDFEDYTITDNPSGLYPDITAQAISGTGLLYANFSGDLALCNGDGGLTPQIEFTLDYETTTFGLTPQSLSYTAYLLGYRNDSLVQYLALPASSNGTFTQVTFSSPVDTVIFDASVTDSICVGYVEYGP